MFPAARFLVMARNPLEMLPSWHARVLFTMEEDVVDFEPLGGSKSSAPRAGQFQRNAAIGACFNTLRLVG